MLDQFLNYTFQDYLILSLLAVCAALCILALRDDQIIYKLKQKIETLEALNKTVGRNGD
jgi:hypothetical protein